MLNPEYLDFCRRWLDKAEQNCGDTLAETFDRYFTLFVVFNRLYVESFHARVRDGKIPPRKGGLKDRDGATTEVLSFLGGQSIMAALRVGTNSPDVAAEFIALLSGPAPSGRRFCISLKAPSGTPQPERDKALRKQLQSADADEQALGALRFLYAVRCNLFHGHKGFEEVQRDVLRPANEALKRITVLLLQRLGG
jgi:hypothetical protein